MNFTANLRINETQINMTDPLQNGIKGAFFGLVASVFRNINPLNAAIVGGTVFIVSKIAQERIDQFIDEYANKENWSGNTRTYAKLTAEVAIGTVEAFVLIASGILNSQLATIYLIALLAKAALEVNKIHTSRPLSSEWPGDD